MIYNKIVQDCFFRPKHVGIIDVNKPLTVFFRSSQKNQSTTVIDIYMQCAPSGLIQRVCFKVTGNPFAVAAVEWLCRQTEGQRLASLKLIDYPLLIKELEIPSKHHPIALQVEDVYKEVLVLMKKKFK